MQRQFVFISAGKEITGDNIEIINEIRIEFQSLVTFENNLVFPSVIKAFDKNLNSSIPDVAGLQALTLKKEKKLLQLLNELEKASVQEGSEIQDLISIFKKDFTEKRKEWNALLIERQLSCSCFQRNSGMASKLEHSIGVA